MARYEHLPIYKKAFDLAVHFEKVVAGFSRYHKYTLGTELRNRSREIVLAIIRANSSRDKAPHLMQLRNDLEELLLLIRLCKETKAFKSFKAFQFVAEEVTAVSRQNEGWLRVCKNKRGPESAGKSNTLPAERADYKHCASAPPDDSPA
jgi:hypothetical protein